MQLVCDRRNPNFAFHVEYCTPIQYSCHVFTTVFRCRFLGERLDVEAVRAAPPHGELIVHRRGMVRVAKLLAADGVTYATRSWTAFVWWS